MILFLLLLFALAMPSPLMAAQGRPPLDLNQNNKYPHELPGFRFYQDAKWKTLEPLVSSMADVRRVLGSPTKVHDISHYAKPYPGDAFAQEPVFTYDTDEDWKILVYFVRYCSYDGPDLPESMGNRLCTIELLPKKRISFKKVVFPSGFKKRNVTGVYGNWDEYKDGTGLAYAVYTGPTTYGDEQPGDLNRIRYGPSDEALSKLMSMLQP